MILPLPLLPVAGISLWPFIFLRWDRRADTALIAHEKVHAKRQAPWAVGWAVGWAFAFVIFAFSPWFLILALFHPWYWAYLGSKSFRFKEELLGYRAQIEAGGMTPERAALSLSNPGMYRLGKTYEECLEALRLTN